MDMTNEYNAWINSCCSHPLPGNPVGSWQHNETPGVGNWSDYFCPGGTGQEIARSGAKYCIISTWLKK